LWMRLGGLVVHSIWSFNNKVPRSWTISFFAWAQSLSPFIIFKNQNRL
jgi:hypothetical protein